MGEAVGDRGRTALQAARDFEVSWPIAHQAFHAYAAFALSKQTPAVEHLGIDEIQRGKPRFRLADGPGGDAWEVTAD